MKTIITRILEKISLEPYGIICSIDLLWLKIFHSRKTIKIIIILYVVRCYWFSMLLMLWMKWIHRKLSRESKNYQQVFHSCSRQSFSQIHLPMEMKNHIYFGYKTHSSLHGVRSSQFVYNLQFQIKMQGKDDVQARFVYKCVI